MMNTATNTPYACSLHNQLKEFGLNPDEWGLSLLSASADLWRLTVSSLEDHELSLTGIAKMSAGAQGPELKWQSLEFVC